MAASEPFLSPERKECTRRCFICFQFLKKNDKCSGIGKEGFETFQEQATSWSQIKVPFELKEHNFTEVLLRLEKHDGKEKIVVHQSCRTNFRNKIKKFQERHGLINVGESSFEENAIPDSSESSIKHATRSVIGNVRTLEKKCFICNEIRPVDNEAYTNGGLARITREDTAHKIQERKNIVIANAESRFFQAAQRLNILLSGSAHDVFAADIFYHQSCYIKFVIKPVKQQPKDVLEKNKRDDVLDLFKYRIKTKIIRDKKAYLLHELLKDIIYLSEEHDLETSAIAHTSSLKRYLVEEYSNDIAFFRSGKYLLVHPIDINPCTYSIATLHGCGLRDADITKAFGRMLRRKLNERQKSDVSWPLTPEELLSRIDTGPLPEIYNAIYFSIYESGSINQYGYASTSHIKATKIWALASDWEGLITKQRKPKQIILGMVLHRITGMKNM